MRQCGGDRAANRLGGEVSPYLREHACDPIDWYPWGPEAFERARSEGRPIFVSVGYATCHWCHVMHEESFSDTEVARVLNENFVCVKVDREERPDLDQYFMDVCVALTGSGGWPLSLFLTPEGHPFFAATYIPRMGRGGSPGILDLLGAIARYWGEHREDAVENSREIHRQILRARDYMPKGSLPADAADRLYAHLASIHDPVGEGFGPPPLFPMPHVHLFLLRYASVSRRSEPLDLSCRVMRAMARGGVYDQLGGGFHRYSTDGLWLVPHFEKMLYDQALAALAYSEAFSLTGDVMLGRIARECAEYMCGNLQAPEGGFYAGEDADSGGKEGAFYTWIWEEVDSVLDAEEREVASRIFLIGGRGREEDPGPAAVSGREIPGVLSLSRDPREQAGTPGIDGESFGETVARVRSKLLAARNGRPRPSRDTLILADWNGLAISALAVTSRVFGEPAFLQAAVRAAEFVLRSLRSPDGGLFHRWSEGYAAVEGMSADYAGMVTGLVDLFLATGRPAFLSAAIELENFHEEEFWDNATGGYFVTRASVHDVPARRKEFLDGSIPSHNALSVHNLARLHILTGEDEYLERIDAIARYYAPLAEAYPVSCSMFFAGKLLLEGRSGTVVLTGGEGGPLSSRIEEVVDRDYTPFVLPVRMRDRAGAEEISRLLPWCAPFLGGAAVARAHVCTGNVCHEPVVDPGTLDAILKSYRPD